MSRSNIMAAATSLLEHGNLILPDVAFVQQLAPHLEEAEVAGLFVTAKRDGFVNFIGPPVSIRGAEHCYTLFNDTGLRVSWNGAYRRRESYAMSPLPTNWKHREYDYRERASNYAEINYGAQLCWDEAVQFVEYKLTDPTTNTTTSIIASYKDTWDDLRAYAAPRCPFAQVLDLYFFMAARLPLVTAEMLGESDRRLVCICHYCGGGLIPGGFGYGVCSFCGAAVTPLSPIDASPIPLHMRVWDLLQMASSFKIHPVNALKAHYAKWAATDFQAPPSLRLKQDRLITLRE